MANFTIFDSAITALNANSFALSIAGQNIANVNTPGYSRQSVGLTSVQPQISGGLDIGRGVQISDVTRSVDIFAEIQLRNANKALGYQESRTNSLVQIESLFNEVASPGLASFVTDMFAAFQDVANNPSTISTRLNLLGKAEIVVERFNSLADSLTNERRLIDSNIETIVDRINNISDDIADINGRIAASDGQSLVLRDQRNVLVQELSNLVDTTAIDNSDGEFQVYVGDGLQLVSGVNYNSFELEADPANNGLSNVLLVVGTNDGQDVTARFNSGQLKGLIDTRDTSIPAYQDRLDEFAYELATEINSVHTAGFDLDGDTAQDFFANLASADGAASLISLDAAVDGLPRNIQVSGLAVDVPGGNSTALAISALQTTSITFTTGDTTFSDFYGNFLSEIGNDSESAQNQLEFSESIFIQAEIQRERTSGVSIEEEQLDLIKFQTAFEAASRLVSIAEELLTTLVNLGNR